MAELGRYDLQTLAEGTNIIDNTKGDNTPLDVRNQYENERDSTLNKVDDGLEVLDVNSGKLLAYSDVVDLSQLTGKTLTSKSHSEEISTESITTHVEASDPHNQYHNNVRGDVRYYTKSEIDTYQGLQDTAIGLNTSKVSADGSVDTHNDVDLNNVTTFNNSILKYDGANYIPCLNQVYKAPTLIINNTNVLTDVVNATIDIQRLNPHKITISYGWSLNAGAQDFVSEMSFDGQDVQEGLSNNSEIHRQEPKDVAGTDPDGRGTDQRYRFSGVFFLTPISLGINQILLQMRGSTNNDLASIWDVKIEVEEYINVNNL